MGRRLSARGAGLGIGIALVGVPVSAHAAFAPATGSPFATGANGTVSVAIADVDGDARQDVLAVNLASNSVTVMRSTGDGVLAPLGSPIASATAPVAIAVGQFGGSAAVDMVVLNSSSNSVNVFAGDGQGGFAKQGQTIPAGGGSGPLALAAGDVDGDGDLDVAITETTGPSSGDGSITVLHGNGMFALGSPTTIAVPGIPPAGGGATAPSRPSGVALSDLTGDGRPELLIGDAASPYTLRVLLNDGTGAYTDAPGSPHVAGRGAQGLASGDLDGDGHRDAVVASYLDDRVDVYLGDGSGNLHAAAGSPRTVADAPVSLGLDDVNADGHVDIAAGALISNDVSVLLGDGVGGFAAAPGGPFATSMTDQRGIAVGDVSGDGRPDIVTADRHALGAGTVAVLVNTFAPAPSFDPGVVSGVTVKVGAADTRTVTLHNGGDAPLVVGASGVSPAGPWSLADGGTCTGASLVPGASCAMTVRFAPTAPGVADATLAVGGAGSVPLSGTGEAAPVTKPPEPPSPVAQPVTTLSVTPTDSGTRAHPRNLRLKYVLEVAADTGPPPTAKAFAVSLSSRFRSRLDEFDAKCTTSRLLDGAGPSACRKAQVGSGTARVQIGHKGTIVESLAVRAFAGVDGDSVLLYLKGTSPVSMETVIKGTVKSAETSGYGRKLDFAVPTAFQSTAGVPTPLVRLSVSFDETKRVDGKSVAPFQSIGCPSSRVWPVTTLVSYAPVPGATLFAPTTVKDTTPCTP